MATTGLVKTIADFETTLATGVAVSDTTATLSSATDADGVALPSGVYAFTIDKDSSNKEYFSCSLSGTALTNIKTLARKDGAETSGFARKHRKGANIIISDFAAIRRIQDVLETGYEGTHTPATDYELATKKYVDDASFAGATNASTTTGGVVELPTQAEVDAGTASGGSSPLSVTPDTLRAKKYHDAVASAVGTDSYAITVSPTITAYSIGQEFTFIADVANTGACTLAVSGLTAKTIKKNVSDDLTTGDILAGQTVKVMYDGTNMQLINNLPSSVPIVRTYLNAGSPATWTKPTGLKYVVVEVQAGGGGGGGSSTGQAASGGGGGGYSKKTIPASSLGSTETVTTGAGGTSGSSGTGGTGGSSSFGSHATATGGTGGQNDTNYGGGEGGIGSSGDINIKGGGGTTGDTQNNTGNTGIHGGAGGNSVLGGGAACSPIATSGSVGGVYGGGGSGGNSNKGGSAQGGGVGGAGIVIVTEYY